MLKNSTPYRRFLSCVVLFSACGKQIWDWKWWPTWWSNASDSLQRLHPVSDQNTAQKLEAWLFCNLSCSSVKEIFFFFLLIRFLLCSSWAHLSHGCKLDTRAASGYSAAGGFFSARLNKGWSRAVGIRMLESFSLFAAGWAKKHSLPAYCKASIKGSFDWDDLWPVDAHVMQMSVQTRNGADYFSLF